MMVISSSKILGHPTFSEINFDFPRAKLSRRLPFMTERPVIVVLNSRIEAKMNLRVIPEVAAGLFSESAESFSI